jgi:hypothetical protein
LWSAVECCGRCLASYVVIGCGRSKFRVLPQCVRHIVSTCATSWRRLFKALVVKSSKSTSPSLSAPKCRNRYRSPPTRISLLSSNTRRSFATSRRFLVRYRGFPTRLLPCPGQRCSATLWYVCPFLCRFF